MTQEMAEYLIQLLKEICSEVIYIPINGEKKEYLAYEIEHYNYQFLIIIRRGNRNPNKCTFHVMVKNNKECLLRLDIVDEKSCHMNPDHTFIYGPHIHVYREGEELAYAEAFNIKNPSLVQYCIEFFKKMNIINIDEKYFIDTLIQTS